MEDCSRVHARRRWIWGWGMRIRMPENDRLAGEYGVGEGVTRAGHISTHSIAYDTSAALCKPSRHVQFSKRPSVELVVERIVDNGLALSMVRWGRIS